LDLAHLPPDDPAVYKMLQQADTVGIFQVESRAQMATLPRLQPRKFYDIVVEVALIRPGPIVGNMVHPYLKRRQGKEPVSYPHPSLEPILKRTLGVPLFQEQLLRIAMVAAGFSGGEAEELRRAFGFKRSEQRMQQIEGKLRIGMEKQGITGQTAEAIITSITSFALYGFPESHSASFALLVYASAYLKAHYPSAFYTAMLNNQPMGFYHPATLVKDAQRHGVSFTPIDVQESDWECRVEPDGRVRLGLMYVNGLREEAGRTIADRRRAAAPQESTRMPGIPRCPKCGCDDESMLEKTPDETRFCNICAHEWSGDAVDPATPVHPASVRYASIEDLVARAKLRRDELATLADIGALNALGYDRRSALWQIEKAVRPATRAPRTTGASGGCSDHTAAARNRERLRLPDARRRDRHLQHHRPARSVHRIPPDDRRRPLPADRRHPADPGRSYRRQGRTGHQPDGRRTGTAVPRFPVARQSGEPGLLPGGRAGGGEPPALKPEDTGGLIRGP
jgi:error-prone DNA polymerase